MSEKTKEIILKTLIVFALVFGFMGTFGLFPLGLLVPDPQVLEKVQAVSFILGSITVAVFIILQVLFGGMKSKSVKSDERPYTYSSYDEFSDYIRSRLLQINYKYQGTLPLSQYGCVSLYLKSSTLNTIECVSIIRIPELTDELVDNANDDLTELLSGYSGGYLITDSVDMISVFCVDRVSPTFRKIVNGGLQQGLKNGRLNVGISFGGKKLYIASQKDGFAIAKFKRLKKELMKILELK